MQDSVVSARLALPGSDPAHTGACPVSESSEARDCSTLRFGGLHRGRLVRKVPVAALALAAVLCVAPLAGCSGGQAGDAAQASSATSSSAEAADPATQDTPAPDAAADPAANGTVDTRSLQAAIAPVATDTSMDASITCIDLSTGTTASIAGMNVQPASGLINLAVAAAFFDNEAAGVISLDEEHTIEAYEVVGGSGVYQDMVGQTVTMRDVVTKMIANNDNVATNIIINRLGMYTVNSSIQKLGFASTQLVTTILDPESSRWSNDNVTSSDDVASMLRQIYEGTLVSPEASAFILEVMRAQTDTEGILGGLPQGTSFAHKTASSWNCRHDAGIVEGARPYALVVMCSEQQEDIDNAAALDLLNRAGAAASSAIAG